MTGAVHPAYDWFGLNGQLFALVNDVRAPALDALMLSASALGHPRLYPFYVALALWISWRRPDVLPRRNLVVFAAAFALVSALIVPVLKDLLDLPRPLAVLGARAHVLAEQELGHAFPSGHAAFATLLACALAPGTPRIARAAFVLYAVLVGLSRISLGAHFPADVLAGATIGWAVVGALNRVMRAPDAARMP